VKFTLDTNVFVDAFRDDVAANDLETFLERALPMTFLSAVVMQELAAGAPTREKARRLESLVFRPFDRRGRVFAPSVAAFAGSGWLLAKVAAHEGWTALRENPSLANDALLATSCRERGITLVTRDRDFDRFLPFLGRWRHVTPWPPLSRVRAPRRERLDKDSRPVGTRRYRSRR